LAAPAYTCLEPHEVDELTTDLAPVVAKINADNPFLTTP
jgi:hypothetical protein